MSLMDGESVHYKNFAVLSLFKTINSSTSNERMKKKMMIRINEVTEGHTKNLKALILAGASIYTFRKIANASYN